MKRQAASTKLSSSTSGQDPSTPAAAQPTKGSGLSRQAENGAATNMEQWQVPERFRPASAAAAAGRKPSIEQMMVERKFEKKVQ